MNVKSARNEFLQRLTFDSSTEATFRTDNRPRHRYRGQPARIATGPRLSASQRSSGSITHTLSSICDAAKSTDCQAAVRPVSLKGDVVEGLRQLPTAG